MCPICFGGFPALNTVGLSPAKTEKFCSHVDKHNMVGKPFQCESCQLSFVKYADYMRHRGHHVSHAGCGCKFNSYFFSFKYCEMNILLSYCGLICKVVFLGVTGIRCRKYRPISLREERGGKRLCRRLLREIETKAISLSEARCIECHKPMDTPNHYNR